MRVPIKNLKRKNKITLKAQAVRETPQETEHRYAKLLLKKMISKFKNFSVNTVKELTH